MCLRCQGCEAPTNAYLHLPSLRLGVEPPVIPVSKQFLFGWPAKQALKPAETRIACPGFNLLALNLRWFQAKHVPFTGLIPSGIETTKEFQSTKSGPQIHQTGPALTTQAPFQGSKKDPPLARRLADSWSNLERKRSSQTSCFSFVESSAQNLPSHKLAALRVKHPL